MNAVEGSAGDALNSIIRSKTESSNIQIAF